MIAIGLPTNRLVKPKTAESLLRLVAHSQFHIIVSSRGFTTAENRNWIVAQAIKANSTHLFLVDDDMIYPENIVDKLLAHNKDIIGADYQTKYETQTSVTEFLDDERGLVEVGALGGGAMLIKTDVFRKVPQPHFGYIWNDNGSIKESNDWYFCHKAREHGFEVWCDTSIKVGHIGIKEF